MVSKSDIQTTIAVIDSLMETMSLTYQDSSPELLVQDRILGLQRMKRFLSEEFSISLEKFTQIQNSLEVLRNKEDTMLVNRVIENIHGSLNI
ncbi:hypothetical protein DASC09_002740 [Saccharomycopsis crataegensis]|uniref:Uncharacterized protein n=1 Tax=Saccharomycopsis crataegensis TaxID=43959 RepID=A0AAV5QDZ9_9ASCO|nr:hypothetical protein DASC09_002740 [Saccharomycopsis crataegensis]